MNVVLQVWQTHPSRQTVIVCQECAGEDDRNLIPLYFLVEPADHCEVCLRGDSELIAAILRESVAELLPV